MALDRPATTTERVSELAQDLYASRPAHPYNITDILVMAFGATEGLLKQELAKHPEGSPRRRDYEARQRAVTVAWAAYQGATTLLEGH